MLHPWASGKPTLVNFNVEYAWLTRNDKGHITDVRIGNRHYGFNVDEKGRVVSHSSWAVRLSGRGSVHRLQVPFYPLASDVSF